MAIDWRRAYSSSYEYCSIGVDWQQSIAGSTSSIAPIIYRYDLQNTNDSATFDEYLWSEPDGSTGHWSGISFGGTASGTRAVDTFQTRTYSRTHSDQIVSLTIVTSSNFGTYHTSLGGFYTIGSKNFDFQITIPARESYAVEYDANGGSGAPSNQTKWYKEDLVLSSTEPTRDNYNFLGWATSSSATVSEYAPGSTYTGNAALKLYAVWELASLPPQSSYSAYRVSAENSTEEKGSGSWIYIKNIWSIDTSTIPDNVLATITTIYRKDAGDVVEITPKAAQSGTSGIAEYWFEASPLSKFDITSEIKDTAGLSTTSSSQVGDIDYIIKVYEQTKLRIRDLSLDTPLPVSSGGTGVSSNFIILVTSTKAVSSSDNHIWLEATAPEGYSPLFWVHQRTEGFIGGPYIASYSISGRNSSCLIYWGSTGSGSVGAECVCVYTG